MQKTTSTTPPRRRIRNRSLGLLLLFLIAGSFSYPAPFNWLMGQVQGILGVKGLGRIEKPFVLGLDLQGGTRLEYEADVSRVAASDRTEALNGVRDVLERRVNALGVAEPSIQTIKAGEAWRVNLELAGVRDISQAIKMIGETPTLEFKEPNDQKDQPLTAEQQKQIDTQNAEAKKKAEAILAEVRKPGADFAAIAKQKTENESFKDNAGDVGFIQSKQEYSDVYAAVKNLNAGTILPRVLERSNFESVVKVEAVDPNAKEVHASHLLISYKGAPAIDISTFTKEEARARIDALRKQLTPANFNQLTAENSQEPGAIESKGDLGWFGKGKNVEEFEKVAFAQKVGTISEVIETPFGFHLIYKMAERPVRDVRVRLIDVKRLTAADIVGTGEWKSTKLTGKQLSSARVDFDQQTGAIQVALQFNDEGAKLFADLTKRNLGKPIGIFLDGEVISAPTVQTQIDGGQAVITGNFSLADAKKLARNLQQGALPVPIKLIAQQTVGPTLGADSLQRSLWAGLVGFLLVALYMIVLYRLPGFVSIVALVLYAAVSAAIFKLIPVTLTLSGIAGFILSIGIAVDANVLVFERLKEEWREGKGFVQALEDAFKRAWPSIRDGHATVLISCAVLYWFSSSIIKGFALTLAIGTIISLFTAVVSCRTLLRLFIGTRIGNNGWLFLKK